MIIVLGGAGFLGQHFQKLLLARGLAFTVISRRPAAGSFGPHRSAMTAAEFRGAEGDRLIRSASGIVNMISSSVPSTFAAEPWREVPENVAPTAELFARCARLNPEAKFVHLSSGGTVYGRISTPSADELTPAEPISGYGMGKLMIEQALRFTGRTTGMPYAILRVSNPIGIYQTSPAQGIVPIAIRAAHHNQPFRLFGDGSNVRDYLDADDVADAVLAACLDLKFLDRIWNVGSGKGLSILQMLDLVEATTGRTLRVERSPERAVDVARVVLDCTRIQQELGWQPRRNIMTTIAQIDALATAANASPTL